MVIFSLQDLPRGWKYGSYTYTLLFYGISIVGGIYVGLLLGCQGQRKMHSATVA
jgi:hypothetical protein